MAGLQLQVVKSAGQHSPRSEDVHARLLLKLISCRVVQHDYIAK